MATPIDTTFTGEIVTDPASGLECVRMPGSAEFFGTAAAVTVSGTVDGHEYEATLLPVGDGVHILPLRAPFREVIGKGIGNTVEVHLTQRFS